LSPVGPGVFEAFRADAGEEALFEDLVLDLAVQ
jgi:hypothetical protein